MRSYVHWLKIRGTVSTREELRQYREIYSYLKRYPGSTAITYLYDMNLFDRAVRLECNQNWDDLDLMANSMSNALMCLTHKPTNIGNPRPFQIPEWLMKEYHSQKAAPAVTTAQDN